MNNSLRSLMTFRFTVAIKFVLILFPGSVMSHDESLVKFEAQFNASLPPLIQMARSPLVMNELDLSDEQIFELKNSLRHHLKNERRSQNSRRSPTRTREEGDDEIAKPIEEILNDEQFFRLRQLRAQSLGIAADPSFGLTKFFQLNDPTKRLVHNLAAEHKKEFSKAGREAVKGVKQAIGELHRSFLDLLDSDQQELFDDTFGPLMLRDEMIRSWTEEMLSSRYQMGKKTAGSPFVLEHADRNINPSIDWYLPTPAVIEALELSNEQLLQLQIHLHLHDQKLEDERAKFYSGEPSRYARTQLNLDELPFTTEQKNRYIQLSRQNYGRLDDDHFFAFDSLQPFLEINHQQMLAINKKAESLPKQLEARCRVLIDDLVSLRKEQLEKTLREVPVEISQEYREIFGEILFKSEWMNTPGVKLESPFELR